MREDVFLAVRVFCVRVCMYSCTVFLGGMYLFVYVHQQAAVPGFYVLCMKVLEQVLEITNTPLHQ